MTAAEARSLQDEARNRGEYLVWFVTITDAHHLGKAVAWAMKADTHGGAKMPGVLVADTLAELRTMLPAGLTRRDPTPMMPVGVVEAWDCRWRSEPASKRRARSAAILEQSDAHLVVGLLETRH